MLARLATDLHGPHVNTQALESEWQRGLVNADCLADQDVGEAGHRFKRTQAKNLGPRVRVAALVGGCGCYNAWPIKTLAWLATDLIGPTWQKHMP